MDLSRQQHMSETVDRAYNLSTSQTRYRAYFFGPFRVTRDEIPLGEATWRRNKARLLLKWFLLNPGDLFSIDQLCTLFWSSVTSKVAASNLHVTLHYLRHILEPELAAGSPSTFIRRNRHNYYWFDLGEVWWTDLLDIRHLTVAAKGAEQRGELAQAFVLYGQLTSYYRRKFLPEDVYEDIFSPYRRQHDYAYVELTEHVMQLYMHTGQLEEAHSCALNILALNPYSESAIKTIVHIQLRQGNTIGAICQLDEFRHALQEELGIEPGQDLCALRDSILETR